MRYSLLCWCLCLFCALNVSAAERWVGDPLPPGPGDNAAHERQYLRNVRRLTYAGTKNGEAYFHPNGRQIVFQGVREGNLQNPFYQIYTQDLETGKTVRITAGTGRTTCSYFHPRKNRVLFASSHLNPQARKEQNEELEKLAKGVRKRYEWDFDPFMDIFESDLDGGNPVRLTSEDGYDAECAYSPDGTQIVFCSFRDPDGGGEIYLMQADGSNPRRLTHYPGYDGGPFFSPDGTRIVWRRFAQNDKVAEIWSMNLDGTDARALTSLNAVAWAPYYHASGKWIVFSCNHEDPGFELYAMRADGSDLRRITYAEGFDGLPVCSPDGRYLMWTSTRDRDNSHLYLAELNLPEIEKAPLPIELKPPHHPIDTDRILQHLQYLGDEVTRQKMELQQQYVAKRFAQAGLKALRDTGEETPDYRLTPESSSLCGVLLPMGVELSQLRDPQDATHWVLLAAQLKPQAEGAGFGMAGTLSVLIEAMRELSGVARFKGLQTGVVCKICSAIDPDTAELPSALGLKLPAAKFAQALWIDDVQVSGKHAVWLAQGSAQGWRLLAEELSAANAGLRHYFIDERNWQGIQGISESLSTFQKLAEQSRIPSLVLTARGERQGLEPPQFDRLDVRDRAKLLLGALYRLSGGTIEVKQEATTRAMATAGKRVYLGTKPSYAEERSVNGVLLEHIYADSPAAAAGLKQGDRILMLGDHPVRNVNELLDAIEQLQPERETPLEIQRGDERLKLKIVPRWR